MSDPSVPNLESVYEDQDYECIIDSAPVEEVEASDRVAQNADSMDSGFSMVGHHFYMERLV